MTSNPVHFCFVFVDRDGIQLLVRNNRLIIRSEAACQPRTDGQLVVIYPTFLLVLWPRQR